MDITEKSAYLKGLYEGFGIDASKPEGKLISELVNLVSEMAEKINNLEVECHELRDYCEELDQDLGDIEEFLYDDEEYEEYEEDDEDDELEGTEYYEVTCPSCGEVVCFDESVDPEHIKCPACGQYFDCTCDPENCDNCDRDCKKDEE